MSQKKSLEEQSTALLKGRADWLEPFQNWILTARNAGEIAVSGSLQEKRVLASKSVRLEPCPRLQKSPWFLRQTVVTTRRIQSNWWNGGLAGTRTLDQCLKRALLYQLSYQPILLFINDF